ncbi:MAG TPA: alpha/beta fold hydrolase [Ktedonobacterales bacterium]|jgi:proline iminopeptidase
MAANQNDPQDSSAGGRHVNIGDTRLFLVERGQGHPVLVLHGGPGLDHWEFADYLDALTDQFRLILVDQRSQGRSDMSPPETWTLPQMAKDVSLLAGALHLSRYTVLGHSYGAFVALQHAVDFPGAAAQTIVSSGLPSAKYLEQVGKNLAAFEPVALREQVTASWEREKSAQTQEDCASLMHDQLPFHFGNPLDPRIAEYEARTADTVYSPHVLRHFANQDYGMIEVEDRLAQITQPLLVLGGRLDRTCTAEGAKAIAIGAPHAELVIFEHSGHMTFVEENAHYVQVVREWLGRWVS